MLGVLMDVLFFREPTAAWHDSRVFVPLNMSTHHPDIKSAAMDFLRKAAAGKASEAFALHVSAGFRHHNPYFRGDAESLKNAMQQNAAANPGKIFEIQRALQEGDLVAVHSRVRQNPKGRGAAVVHLFRFSQGRIEELWDVGQAEPEKSVNENGMF
jgi:predicted SnoaL-like aldol condensation-catalyzing enzyme